MACGSGCRTGSRPRPSCGHGGRDRRRPCPWPCPGSRCRSTRSRDAIPRREVPIGGDRRGQRPPSCAPWTCPGWSARLRLRPERGRAPVGPGRWAASPHWSTGRPGRETQVADPDGYLVRWRDRGPLTPAVEAHPGRPVGAAPCGQPGRPTPLAAAVEPTELRRGLERAVDRAIGGLGPLEPPTSRWWSVIGSCRCWQRPGSPWRSPPRGS